MTLGSLSAVVIVYAVLPFTVDVVAAVELPGEPGFLPALRNFVRVGMGRMTIHLLPLYVAFALAALPSLGPASVGAGPARPGRPRGGPRLKRRGAILRTMPSEAPPPAPKRYVLRRAAPARTYRIDYHRELNSEQQEVVFAPDGPTVVDGRGRGREDAHARLPRLAPRRGRRRPEALLLLTFTNRAAREMTRRTRQLLGSDLDADDGRHVPLRRRAAPAAARGAHRLPVPNSRSSTRRTRRT